MTAARICDIIYMLCLKGMTKRLKVAESFHFRRLSSFPVYSYFTRISPFYIRMSAFAYFSPLYFSPAKGVGLERVARVQIPLSPPKTACLLEKQAVVFYEFFSRNVAVFSIIFSYSTTYYTTSSIEQPFCDWFLFSAPNYTKDKEKARRKALRAFYGLSISQVFCNNS